MPRRRSVSLTLLRFLLILLVLAVLGVGVAASQFDANTLKPRIEAAVQQATGRAFAIRGPLRLQWHDGLVIEATDLALANLPGGSRPDMVRIPAVTARVALPPLVGGEARIDALEVVAPDVLLERDAAGQGNWQFQPQPAPPPQAAAAPAARGLSLPSWLHMKPSIRIVSLLSQGGHVTWHEGSQTAAFPFGIVGAATLLGAAPVYDLQFTVTGHSLAPMPEGDRLRDPVLRLHVHSGAATLADLSAMVGTEHVRAHAILPPPEILSAGIGPTTRLPVDLSLETAAGTATVKGSVTGRALDADVAIRATQGAAYGLGDGALSLDGHVVTGPDSVDVSRLAFSGPLGDLSGTLAVTLAPRPKLVGRLVSRRLDAGRLRAALLAYGRASAAPAVAAPAPLPPASPEPPHLLSDAKLPFDRLRAADADLALSVAELVDGGIAYRDVSGHLLLQDGRLALDPLAGTVPGAKLAGSAHIDAAATPPSVAAVLHAPAVALDTVLAAAGYPGLATGTAMLDLDLRGSGDNPRALAASLDGQVSLTSTDGAFGNALLSDILAAAHLPPLGGGGLTTLRCLAVRMQATRGRVAIEPLVIDSPRLLLQGAGTVDLGAELIAMQLRPMLRTGPGIVVPLHVTGPLRAPKLGVDAGATLTGLLTDRGADPCGPALSTIRGAPVNLPPLPVQNGKPPKPADLLRSLLR